MLTRNKFKAQKITVDGIKFASKLEAGLYMELKVMMQGGILAHLEVQPKVYLSRAKILYKPDFITTHTSGQLIYWEAKGFSTAAWNIKKRLWRFYGPAPLYIFRGSMSKIETVVPIDDAKMN